MGKNIQQIVRAANGEGIVRRATTAEVARVGARARVGQNGDMAAFDSQACFPPRAQWPKCDFPIKYIGDLFAYAIGSTGDTLEIGDDTDYQILGLQFLFDSADTPASGLVTARYCDRTIFDAFPVSAMSPTLAGNCCIPFCLGLKGGRSLSLEVTFDATASAGAFQVATYGYSGNGCC